MQLRCTALPLPRARRSLRDPRKERWSLKLTRHNGRAGKHGTYNPKHNDRSFEIANSEHIDPERVQQNIYWDCYNGIRSALQPKDVDSLADTFEEVEKLYYKLHYTNFTERQNERNAKIRHTERNRSAEDLLASKKTCPEESIYQLGTLESHASPKELFQIATEFMDEFHERFGKHVHILDWALHLDEGTPHIHERHVFDCENKYGEIAPQQEKALEALGFELPKPDKPLGRYNNRKITFDAACRKMLFEIAKRHGLELEEEAEYGNRKYLEKQDFILAKQKEQLAAQQNRLDALTLKVSDMETLLEDISAAAYDKAVEVVTDVVRTETRKEDMRMIEETKKWVLSPERKAPKATREYAAHRLDGVLDKFLKTMQTTATRLQEKLLRPEIRQKGKEQVREKARDSVLQLLSRLQAEQAQNKPAAQPRTQEGHSEIRTHRERLGQKAGTFCPGTRLQGNGGLPMNMNRPDMTEDVKSKDYTNKSLQKDSNPVTMEASKSPAIESSDQTKAVKHEPLVYRVEEIAQLLAISPRAAYNLCNTTKDFRVLRIGTSIRVNKQSFDNWFAAV